MPKWSRCLALLFAMVACAAANTIDLSGHGSFVLSHGQEMKIQFSVWNYGYNNPGVSPYPTSVGLELLGANPEGASLADIPGSNAQYFPDFLLQGTLESLDGSAWAPLQSGTGALLGLSSGSLLVTPAMYYGYSGASAVAAIDAEAALSLTLSEQIFGPSVMSRQSSAYLVLRNLGADLTIGIGNGVSLRNAISEPSITGIGSVQTSGITNRVMLTEVPEPGTIVLTLVMICACAAVLVSKARA